MPDRVASYVEISNELRRITARCDGLIADLRHHQDALLRWQECVAGGAPLEALEAALVNVLDGEPPSWAVVRRALAEWVETTERVRALWAALPAEEHGCWSRRWCVAPPRTATAGAAEAGAGLGG